MNIGIIGNGNVGGTLGERWVKLGHSVAFATRDRASIISVASAAEVVVVALPWDATKGVLESLDLKGKIVFDCTNPLLADLSLAVTGGTSGGEQVAKWAAGASVVKIFNTTGSNNMADPLYGGESTAMFYCGGDERAKTAAAKLAGDLGFDPIDAGPIENARLLEPVAALWIWLAFKGGVGRDFAFRMVRR
jgi:8-hydroxy-5-deazaflavin:NADPH oxidoreductase